MKFKKIFAFVMLMLISVSGLFFGCTDKYSALSVTSNVSELELYLGEDTDMQDGAKPSIGTVKFTVNGAGDGVSTDLKISYDHSIIKRLSKEKEGNVTTITIQALEKGGVCNLVALTEEGEKSCTVKINAIRRAKSMKIKNDYNPAIFNKAGQSLNLGNPIVFDPIDTTQRIVRYSCDVDGVEITYNEQGAVLTLTQVVNATEIAVVAQNVENPALSAEIIVHVIEPIGDDIDDGISIYTQSPLYNAEQNKITLATKGDENNISFNVDVRAGDEDIYLTYKFLNSDGELVDTVPCVDAELNVFEIRAYAKQIGSCKLVIYVHFEKYSDTPEISKQVDIEVVELPSTITINGNASDFSENIYTYYQNNLGRAYTIDVGGVNAYNKKFILATDGGNNLEVMVDDGQGGRLVDVGYTDDINTPPTPAQDSIIDSGKTIYVKGTEANTVSKLYVYAYGTVGRQKVLVRTITLTTLLGSTTVTPDFYAVGDFTPNGYYVQRGHSLDIDYFVSDGANASGITLVKQDGSNLDSEDVASVTIGRGNMPVVTINGKQTGELRCKLVLQNGVESDVFSIVVFDAIEYGDDEGTTGGYKILIDNPQQNSNIANPVFDDYGSLTSVVLSLGSTTKLKLETMPKGAYYTVNYNIFVVNDKNDDKLDGRDYATVTSMGYITTLKQLPETTIIDGEEVAQHLVVEVSVTSLYTRDNGRVDTIESTRQIDLELYIPLTDVSLSKKTSTIYWLDSLNQTQVENNLFQDSFSVSLFPRSVPKSKANISWQASSSLRIDSLGDSAVVQAISKASEAEVSSYTVSVTVRYYSTTIVRYATIIVKKATKATSYVSYVGEPNNTEAYFEMGNGESSDSILPSTLQITTKLYSASGNQNVTFKNVEYNVLNPQIATVDNNGIITPLSAGRTEVEIYPEDLKESGMAPKTITIVVADGLSTETAYKISTEDDFDNIQNNKFYYLANDITFTKNIAFTKIANKFNGQLDGNHHYLFNVSLNNIAGKHYIFDTISADAKIKDLNIQASFDLQMNGDLSVAGLANTNMGSISNVNIYFVKSNITVNTAGNLNIAGLVLDNQGYVLECAVVANIDVKLNKDVQPINLPSLYVGGLVGTNRASIYGLNNNYQLSSYDYVQEFDFSGKIDVASGISATKSAIGGIVAQNNGIVGSNNNSVISGQGYSTDAVITATSINNVGGIAGISNGIINNSLVFANITANNNVGGVVGYVGEWLTNKTTQSSLSIANRTETDNTGVVVNNAIVEMYQDAKNEQINGKVCGNNNVGGLVGYANGYFVTSVNNSGTDDASDDYLDVAVTKTIIKNSYVQTYTNLGVVSGQQNVGGLVGNALYTNIYSSYANTNLDAQKSGGLVGSATDVLVKNAYSLGSANSSVFGSIFGSVLGAQYQFDGASKIQQVYSLFADKSFVGEGEASNYVATNSYVLTNGESTEVLKTSSQLKQASTYSGWKIVTAEPYNSAEWLLDSAKNDGYPVLIYSQNNQVIQKTVPSQIDVTAKQDVEVVDDIIILNTKTTYKLADVIKLTTNVSNSKSAIYVYSSDDSVLNVNNTTNRFSSFANVSSRTQKLVTLTFILSNNTAVKKTIQIAFLDKIEKFNVESVSVRTKAQAQINAIYAKSKAKDGSFVDEQVDSSYLLGISTNQLDTDIVLSDADDTLLDGYTMFGNKIALSGTLAQTKVFDVTLFYVLYLDDNTAKYIPVASYSNFEVNIYSGATAISITNTNLDMTVLDDNFFTVTVKTDREDDILLVDVDSDEIYFENFGNQNVVLNGGTIRADKNEQNKQNAKLILSVAQFDGVLDGEMVVTFEIKFADQYFSTEKASQFNKIIRSNLVFMAQSNKDISKSLQVVARPQPILKADFTNYPAGKIKGNSYTLATLLSNTLTPGQVGMLVVDIYPEYAQFDQIELVSGTDNKGNSISFIQTAETTLNGETSYVEIKPNPELVQNGILLQRVSTADLSEQEAKFAFNGKFFVKTLIGSNVDYDQVITITLIATSNVINANGVVETKTFKKSFDIIVNATPELKLSFDGELEKAYVSQNGKTEQRNIVVKGEALNFDISYEHLSFKTLDYNVVVNGDTNNTNGKNIVMSLNDLAFAVDTSNYDVGTTLTIWANGRQTINGLDELYTSQVIEFTVVEDIITDVQVNNQSTDKMVFVVDEYTPLRVQVFGHINREDRQDSSVLSQIESIINKHEEYWFASQKSVQNHWESWSFDGTDGAAQGITSKYYDAYTAYKRIETEAEPLDSLFGIVATNSKSKNNRFKVEFSYYYQYETINGKTTLTLKLNDSNKNKDMFKTVSRVYEMDIQVNSDVNNPVPVYNIQQFYEMKSGLDYILMNDLSFGVDASLIAGADETKTNEAYKPFELNVASLDGNSHSINIYGNFDVTDSNLGAFTQIQTDTVLLNLDVKYYPAQQNQSYAINLTIDSSSIYFGGLTAFNYGIVSNCNVYYLGDVQISLADSSGIVNIAGFVSQNSGKVTYSSVLGTDWNDNYNSNKMANDGNIKIITANNGNMAGFVNTNSNLISSCSVEFVGLENDATVVSQAKVAGFAIQNGSSARIISSSVAGQRLIQEYDYYKIGEIDSAELVRPLKNGDSRLLTLFNKDASNYYFAELVSKSIVAGFIYTNAGEIRNAYSAIPMATDARTSGFVFDNSNGGKIYTSYTASYYDGKIDKNTAHSYFVGTNEYGEVLNDATASDVEYCYYITDEKEALEDDVEFKDPATRLSINIEDDSSAKSAIQEGSAYVGFDISLNSSVWSYGGKYILPALNFNENNRELRDAGKFRRTPVQSYVKDSSGNNTTEIKIYFPRSDYAETPYTIVNAMQFVDTFNRYSATGYFNYNIRLINDIDLSSYAGTEELNNLRNIVFNGDFDGNGMTISGIKIVGLATADGEDIGDSASSKTNIYSNVSSAFGLFNQIGTATVETKINGTSILSIDLNPSQNKKAQVRNLTLDVKEAARSKSSFTGILAGVIVNADIKSVNIKADGVTILGRNAVGGLAGAVIGNSTLYDVSVNANVTSSYTSSVNTKYQQNGISEYQPLDYYTVTVKGSSNNILIDEIFEKYKDINQNVTNKSHILTKAIKIGGKTYYSKSLDLTKDSLGNNVCNFSYAGGIAGIVDINTSGSVFELDRGADNFRDQHKYSQNSADNINNRQPDINNMVVSGDITLLGEVVGGLFGTINEDAIVSNSKFILSTTDGQRLNGYYTSGALVGINNGGAITLSSVEVASQNVASFDENLTNNMANSLFNGSNIYPFAIGGMVGIQNGGYILSSYSKANVSNSNAKYAGGIIGKLSQYNAEALYGFDADNDTYSQQCRLNKYPLLEEVYTTANVFAGDKFESSASQITINTTTGSSLSVNVYNPTSYVGGIMGYYDANQYSQFNGVDGINAFHKASGYKVSNDGFMPVRYNQTNGQTYYSINADGSYSTKALTYSDIMAGYLGAKTLSTGRVEYRWFNGRIGAIAGETNGAEFGGFGNRNLYTRFVYASESISVADCKNASGTAGLNINHVAYASNGKTVFEDVDTYNYKTLSISINQSATDLSDTTIKKFSKSEAYLLFRGKDVNGGTYSTFGQDENGMFSGWNNNWEFKSPVYPTLKPKDTNAFVSINTEKDLRSIRSGGRYRLESDIYLTSPWIPKALTYATFTGANRTDGLGINGDRRYNIYNINIIDDNNTSVDFGFFSMLSHNSSVSNINFVFGTNFTNPNADASQAYSGQTGFKYDGTATNIGLLVGNFGNQKIASSVSNCNIYLQQNQTYNVTLQQQANSTTHSVGVFAGNTNSTSSNINKVLINSGNISCPALDATSGNLTMATFSKGELNTKLTVVNADEGGTNKNTYVGAFIGNSNAEISNCAVNGVDVLYTEEPDSGADNLYAGGFAGKLETTKDANNIYVDSKLAISLSEYSNSRTLYVGGVAGFISTSGNYDLNCDLSTNIQVTQTDDADKVDVDSAYIGGVVGEAYNLSAKKPKDYTIQSLSIANLNIKNANIGGFAGKLNNCTIGATSSSDKLISTNVNLDAINININNTANDSDVKIGGFAGAIYNGATINNTMANFEEMVVSTNSKNIFVGGFVGVNDSASKLTIANCMANGSIGSTATISSSADASYYLAGFVASGYGNTSGTGQVSTLKITNSASDVSLSFTTSTANMYVAGFAQDLTSGSALSGNVSLGDIIYASQLTKSKSTALESSLFGGKIGGFTTDGSLVNGGANYSLATIYAVGKTAYDGDTYNQQAENIRATSFKDNDNIYYNYNLSGVKQKTTLGKEVTYLQLINGKYSDTDSTRLEFAGASSILKSLLDNGKQNDNNVYNILYGTNSKLSPVVITSDGDAIYATKISVLNTDSSIAMSITEDFTGKLISNSSATATALTLNNKNFSVGLLGFVSGVELCARDESNKIFTLTSPISSNNGYIFNTVSTGYIKYNDDSQEKNISGFLNVNNGIVNACGSMTYLDTNNSVEASANGFVTTNSGVIANSYASNVYYNFAGNTNMPVIDSTHSISGFVKKAQSGIIINCFASANVFDATTLDQKFVNFGTQNSETWTTTNYTNVYAFVSNAGIFVAEKTIQNCYFDNQSNSNGIRYQKKRNFSFKISIQNDNTATGLAYATLKQKSRVMFNSDQNENVNFGYAIPFSYKTTTNSVSTSNLGLVGALNTGDNSKGYPYLVNNIGRYNDVVNTLNSSTIKPAKLYARLVNNIDAKGGFAQSLNLDISTKTNDSQKTIIQISNNAPYAIYNAKVQNVATNDNMGLLSADDIYLNNFGVIGEFAGDVSLVTNASLVVSYAKNITATNSFAIATKETLLNQVQNFGLLLGCADIASINKCFANGDIAIETTIPDDKKDTSVGTLAGKILGANTALDNLPGLAFLKPAIANNSFASGTITIKQHANSKGGSMYVAGLVGQYFQVFSNTKKSSGIKDPIDIDKPIGPIQPKPNKINFLNSYSNVTIKDYTNDDTYKKELVSAIANAWIFAFNGAELIFDNIYSSSDISLCKYSNESKSWLTNTYDTFVSGINNLSEFSANSNHYPIQSVFATADNRTAEIIYNALNINDSKATGSKMSPLPLSIKVVNANDKTASLSTELESKYYYIDKNYNLRGSDISTQDNIKLQYLTGSPKMIIGGGKTISVDNGGRDSLFDGDDGFEGDGIISNLTLTNIALATKFTGYAYAITTNGTLTSSYGFANEMSNAVIYNCKSSGEIIQKSSTTYGGYYSASGFANNISDTIFRDVTSTPTIDIKQYDYEINNYDIAISGIGYGANNIIGDLTIDISKANAKSAKMKSGFVVGGISGYADAIIGSKFYFNLKALKIASTISGNVNTTAVTPVAFGGLFGFARYLDLSNVSIQKSDIYLVVVNILDISNKNSIIYIGGLVGRGGINKLTFGSNMTISYYGTSARYYVGGLTGSAGYFDVGTSTSNSIVVNGEIKFSASCGNSISYVGGIAGVGYGTIQNVNISGKTTFTDVASKSTDYFGGVVGYLDQPDAEIKNITSTALVAGVSTATKQDDYSETTSIYDARTLGGSGNTNYQSNSIAIPLAVGGIIGRLGNSATIGLNVRKPSGDVRGLIDMRLGVYENPNGDIRIGGSKNSDDYKQLLTNTEKFQARVGGYVGLTSDSKTTKPAQSKTVVPGWNRNWFSSPHADYLQIDAYPRHASGYEEQYFYIPATFTNKDGDTYVYTLNRAGYYKIAGLDGSNVYVDFGDKDAKNNIERTGAPFADKNGNPYHMDGDLMYYTTSVSNFNYANWIGGGVTTFYSSSEFGTDKNPDIANTTTNDYYGKLNGTAMFVMYDGATNNWNHNAFYWKDDLAQATTTIGSASTMQNEIKVFAGFMYGDDSNPYDIRYYCYNRSFWLVPGTELYKTTDNGDGWQCKYLKFYPTQHWAGPVVGGVLS